VLKRRVRETVPGVVSASKNLLFQSVIYYYLWMISIGIIEDNRLVREGLIALLSNLSDVRVVASASGDETAMLPDVNAQVILLDVGLSHGHSLRVAKQIRENWPDSRVILMDVLPVYEDLVQFVNAGVSGFVMKDATLEDLISTVRSVAQGGQVLPPQMATTLFARIATDAVVRGRPEALEAVRMTPREREVIDLIAEGLSNKEIATRLEIATDTVKSHVRNVMEKLMLHTRLQIAAFAHRESKG
jgi:two-component system nitrate/nitrite response regulator NarL